jgi:RNA-directed DNA polymerase
MPIGMPGSTERRSGTVVLGYAFGPHCYQRNGNRYLGASPSEKSIKRVKQRINEVLAPGNVKPWAEVRDQLNAILRGRSAYFCYGTRAKAYKAVDHPQSAA